MKYLITSVMLSCTLVFSISAFAGGDEKLSDERYDVMNLGASKLVIQKAEHIIVNLSDLFEKQGEEIKVLQPSDNAILEIIYSGTELTTFSGTLKANGTVIFRNPNGIVFVEESKVKVKKLICITNDFSVENLSNKRITVKKGKIVNNGVLQAQDIQWHGDEIENNGHLEGDEITLFGIEGNYTYSEVDKKMVVNQNELVWKGLDGGSLELYKELNTSNSSFVLNNGSIGGGKSGNMRLIIVSNSITR